MKIEFLYKDNTYESIINGINEPLNLEENEITYTPIVQVGLNIFSFSKSGDNETTAKKLDEIKKTVFQSLDPNSLFVITDGVSSYFCQRLYPQMANFERGLRKVLYIASIKSKDEKVIAICKRNISRMHNLISTVFNIQKIFRNIGILTTEKFIPKS